MLVVNQRQACAKASSTASPTKPGHKKMSAMAKWAAFSAPKNGPGNESSHACCCLHAIEFHLGQLPQPGQQMKIGYPRMNELAASKRKSNFFEACMLPQNRPTNAFESHPKSARASDQLLLGVELRLPVRRNLPVSTLFWTTVTRVGR